MKLSVVLVTKFMWVNVKYEGHHVFNGLFIMLSFLREAKCDIEILELVKVKSVGFKFWVLSGSSFQIILSKIRL